MGRLADYCIPIIFFLFLPIGVFASDNYITPDESYRRDLVKTRVESMPCFVRTRFNADIEKHIRAFVLLAKNNSERLLGKSTIYFHIIEDEINKLGLPDDLKYLTIVESMLDPHAVSNVGAKGMWQLMPFLAEEYDISYTGIEDERVNVARSSAAGLTYLKDLYTRFGNWELALAGYNCGPNRVRKILRQSGKKTYWEIRHLLPKQTREFVPKLIAAKYLFHFYQQHGMKPQFPQMDLQLTTRVKILPGLSFKEIGKILGVDPELLRLLNPSFRIDPKHQDYSEVEITLPTRLVSTYKRHRQFMAIESKVNKYFFPEIETINPYYRVKYVVDEDISLYQFCARHGLSVGQIWMWNGLHSSDLILGQEIFAYNFEEYRLKYRINKDLVSIDSINIDEIEWNMIAGSDQDLFKNIDVKIDLKGE
ncbi:MAG: transglycosylase SLT domain-containing protein [Bacteroidia bacterium]|nr:transglycosylase SLT domain-containing protein [Bacteroidia bacterium]